MTFLAERLGELRRHVDHLRRLRPRIRGPEELRRDLSLHNDLLFSLLTVCQLVIDIAAELSTRRGLAFQDYTEAVRSLVHYDEIEDETVRRLEPLPGFRNVLVHEYVTFDLERAIEAVEELDAVEELIEAVRRIEAAG